MHVRYLFTCSSSSYYKEVYQGEFVMSANLWLSFSKHLEQWRQKRNSVFALFVCLFVDVVIVSVCGGGGGG